MHLSGKAFILLLVLNVSFTYAQMDMISTLLKGRSLTTGEAKQVMVLLNEIKNLVSKNNSQQYSMIEKPENDFLSWQNKINDFSTHTNQKINIMLESISSLRLYATEQLKSLSTRVENLEEQTATMKQMQPTLVEMNSEIKKSESQPLPINSYLLHNGLSASVLEDPHLIQLGSTIQDEPEHSHMESQILNIQNSVSQLSARLETQNQDVLQLNQELENRTQCGCPVNNLQTLLDFINKEMAYLKTSKASIKRNEESLSLLQEKLKLIESGNLQLDKSVLDFKKEINIRLESKNEDSSLKNEILSLKDQIESVGKSLSNLIDNGITGLSNLTTTSSSQGLCVYPYKRAGDSGCFHVFSDAMLAWHDARKACKDIQGDLATPTDFLEFKEFLNKLKLSRSYSYWVGGSDENTEGDWVWLDDRKIDMGVEIWESGQPNQGKSSNCLELKPSVKFAASDQRCSLKRHFICQQRQLLHN